jgi:hypothetical protein
VALDHAFFRPREPSAPAIGFAIALLFALPAMRNTQPEVPPIGVAVDVLGFFWNMSIPALVSGEHTGMPARRQAPQRRAAPLDLLGCPSTTSGPHRMHPPSHRRKVQPAEPQLLASGP